MTTTRFSLIYAALLAAACSSNAGNITGAAASPAVTLSVDVPSRQLSPGDSATFQLFVEQSGGFSGAVNLVAKGLPSGVRAAFKPSAGSPSIVILVLSASNDARESHSTIAIDIESSAIKSRAAAIRLWVAAPSDGNPLKPHASTWRSSKAGG